MAKYVKYILICLFAVFVMSHNAGAINLTLPVDFNTYYRQPYYAITEAGTSTLSSFTNGQLIRYTDSPNVNKITFKTTNNSDLNVSRGDFLLINFYVQQNTLIYDSGLNYPYSFISTIGSAPSCDILKIEFEDQPYVEQTNVKERWNGIITCRVNSDTVNPSINLLVRSNLMSLASPAESLRVGFSNLSVYKSIPSDNDEQAEATQDAADEASSTGSSSEASAEAATSSLISVIGGFVNVITNAQATNCKINMNTTQLQVGEIDLCANPVPSYVQIIGSLILICAVIPLAIILFNRFIGLFRSFQG